MSSSIEVRVGRVPGTVKTVVLAAGSTLGEALSAAEMTLQENEKADLNGVASTTSAVLQDGDTIVIAASAKGN